MAPPVPLDVVVQLVAAAADARAAAAQLRERVPGLRVSVQDATDFAGEVPAARSGAIDIHLMANEGGCWRLTTSAGEAAAIVLARREEAR